MMAPSRRLLTSVALLVVASLLLAVWSLQSGAVTLDFAQVFHALTGRGRPDTPNEGPGQRAA